MTDMTDKYRVNVSNGAEMFEAWRCGTIKVVDLMVIEIYEECKSTLFIPSLY